MDRKMKGQIVITQMIKSVPEYTVTNSHRLSDRIRVRLREAAHREAH